MKSTNNKSDTGLITTLSSIQFGIIILIVIAAVSIAGTLIPQGRAIEFYSEHYNAPTAFLIKIFRLDITYHSPLYIGLLVLFGFNLVLCSLKRIPSKLKSTFRPDTAPAPEKISSMPIHITVRNRTVGEIAQAFDDSGFRLRKIDKDRLYGEKGRIGYLGSTIVHLSLLIFLAGGMVSLLTGKRGTIILDHGETTSVVTLFDESTIPLGFDLTLNRFDVEFYENFRGRPKSFTSRVTVNEPDSEPYDVDIQVNHPLIRNGFTIYQSSYGESEFPMTAAAENDTAIVAVKLKNLPEEVPPIATFEMVRGKQYPVPGFGDSISISIAELHRDFKRIRSVSGEANPAVRLNVHINGETMWAVYAFKNFPGMNMPMIGELDLLFSMEGILTGESVNAVDEKAYFTVLGVARDRGIPMMLIGSIVMIAGFFTSFYIRPKQIWVLGDDGMVLIGAAAKGDSVPLRKFINKTVGK